MKHTSKLTLLIAPALALVAACGESTVGASDVMDSTKESMKDVDLSKLSVEGMQEKADELVGELSSKLDSVKDVASATSVSTAVEPLVDQLMKLKDTLGTKMPGLDSLSGSIEGLKEKFGDNAAVMQAIQPLIDKLQALLK